MTVIVNVLGGPGVGKSTTATGVFSRLKQENVLCEYVNEYPKEIVWEGTNELLKNQIHIFAEQLRRQWRLMGKVDFVITDCPILLNLIYFDYWHKQNPTFTEDYVKLTKEYFLSTFNQFTNVNFYIHRNKPYQEKGRVQTFEEAKTIDEDVWNLLNFHKIPYQITNSKSSIDDIYAFIKTGKMSL